MNKIKAFILLTFISFSTVLSSVCAFAPSPALPETKEISSKNVRIRINGTMTGNYGGCTFTFGIQITFTFTPGSSTPITNVNTTITGVTVNCGSGATQGYARIDDFTYDENSRTFTKMQLSADQESNINNRHTIESSLVSSDLSSYCDDLLNDYVK